MMRHSFGRFAYETDGDVSFIRACLNNKTIISLAERNHCSILQALQYWHYNIEDMKHG